MGLAWLAELIGFLGSLIPQYHHLELTDVGVTITRGSKVKVLSPGLIFYWPVWTTLLYRAANIQTVGLPPQALLTNEKEEVVVGGMVRYKVKDAQKALIETDDVDSAIIDETLAEVCLFVSEHDVSEVQTKRESVNKALTEKVRSALRKYGVYVQRAQLTDFSTCLTLNHVGVKE